MEWTVRLRRALATPAGTCIAGTLVVAIVFAVVLERTYYQYLNYTFLIATAMLHGHLGINFSHPWLDELIPGPGGLYYSVFPLGAVLTVMPAALVSALGLTAQYPVNAMVILAAGGGFGFAYGLTFLRRDFSNAKRLMLATWLLFGSWYLTNMAFAGAWQLAIGLAVLGELGALYFAIVRRKPFWSGVFFSLAFGNRTEILLTAPILLYFIIRPERDTRVQWDVQMRRWWRCMRLFGIVPLALGIWTTAYNYARFGSPFDFGYARIPHILLEPWYRHGIFSLQAIPGNIQAMLFQGWVHLDKWPYLVPYGFSGSILLASPFLLLVVRRPGGIRRYWVGSAMAIGLLTLALWLHGDTGGWQYSYRYALELLPWALVIFTQWLGPKVRWWEAALWTLSVGISTWATYLFMWTNYVH